MAFKQQLGGQTMTQKPGRSLSYKANSGQVL